jgi:voltage-gated potassium channel
LGDLALPRWGELLLVAASVLTIPAALVQHFAADEAVRGTARVVNALTWFAFAAIIVIRARRSGLGAGRWAARHPFDVAVAVFSIPALPLPLQLLRGLWLLGLFRFHGLTRRVFSGTSIRIAVIILLLATLGGGSLFADLESTDLGTGLYWATTTVTTVGYGDVTPHTSGGRFLACVVMIVGVIGVGFLTAAAAERFMRRDRERSGEPEPEAEVSAVMAQLEAIAARLDRIESRIDRQA